MSASVHRVIARTFLRATALVALTAPALMAQERLVGAWSASSGAFLENWSLPTAIGTTTSGGGVAFVTGATQLTLPLAVVVPITSGWTLDAYSAYVRGEVRLAAPDEQGRTSYRLDGPADSRLRLVGQLIGESLLFTAGVTAPTGLTSLKGEQLNALSVLASPALRFRTPFLGAGAGATAGLILARPIGAWGFAFGTSYEARGTYAPAEAQQAGAASTDLRPGNAAHLTIAAERLLGSSRSLLSFGGDLYQAGELRNPTGVVASSTLALGPSFSASYELDAALGSYEGTLYAIGRRRAEYKLGGEPIAGSSRSEVEGGAQAYHAFSSSSAIKIALDARMQSPGKIATASTTTGTETADVGFATAGVKAAGGTFSLRLGKSVGWSIEPYVRGQFGTLDFGSTTRTATGLSGGATLTARF
ncbi:hypothetical protein BH09GEM1_BH09GEM1_38860 [soil metagenome]